MRTNAWLVLALVAMTPVLVACGEDEAPPPPPRPGGAPPPPPPGAPGKPAGPAAGQLQPRMQIEQKIICNEVEKATGPACTPDSLSCEAGLYCLPVTGAGTHCEPCPERDTIRHEFKDRDFVADQMRDPFQSFVIVPQELVEKNDNKPDGGPCTRKEQFVATSYSYMDLRLVGIVSQGTQRKVLMMDRGNLGHIIRRGDCVGKEKAVVKDIGTGYVTFVVQTEEDGRNQAQPPQEHSVQLHPKTLDVAPQDTNDPQAPSAPIVAPPSGKDTGGAKDSGAGQGSAAPAPAAPTK
jgi:Tfp pilus assembly protein PilP